MRIKVPYLTTRPRGDGRLRYYWQPSADLRAHGFALIRLSDDETQAIAEAQSWNAKVARYRAGDDDAANRRPAAGTLADLIRLYRASRYYGDLAPKTRQGYDWCLGIIEDWAGDRPAGAISPADVETLYQTFRRGTPTKANAVLTMARTVYKHGLRIGMVAANPAAADMVRRSGVKPKDRPIWSPEAIDTFVRQADAMGRHSVGTAVLLNSWCGQREGDVLAFGRPTVHDGELHVVQSKTGAQVVLPIDLVPHLIARVQAELARQDGRRLVGLQTLILSEETGQPYTQRNFAEWVERIREAAADTVTAAGDAVLADELRQLQFQRLRATAVVRLAEADVDTLAICAITGHSPAAVETITKHYLVRTRKLARRAFARRLQEESKG